MINEEIKFTTDLESIEDKLGSAFKKAEGIQSSYNTSNSDRIAALKAMSDIANSIIKVRNQRIEENRLNRSSKNSVSRKPIK